MEEAMALEAAQRAAAAPAPAPAAEPDNPLSSVFKPLMPAKKPRRQRRATIST